MGEPYVFQEISWAICNHVSQYRPAVCDNERQFSAVPKFDKRKTHTPTLCLSHTHIRAHTNKLSLRYKYIHTLYYTYIYTRSLTHIPKYQKENVRDIDRRNKSKQEKCEGKEKDTMTYTLRYMRL